MAWLLGRVLGIFALSTAAGSFHHSRGPPYLPADMVESVRSLSFASFLPILGVSLRENARCAFSLAHLPEGGKQMPTSATLTMLKSKAKNMFE